MTSAPAVSRTTLAISDNEFAVFIISIVSGCGTDNSDNNWVAELHSFWPLAGLDAAKLADDAYVRQVMLKFIARLEAARAELRGLHPSTATEDDSEDDL
jgi:hypothetical protein